MDEQEKQIAKTVESAIERAMRTYSRQPRLKMDSEQFFGSVLRWMKVSELECPAYAADSCKRDAWLQANWQREPLWAAVINKIGRAHV